MPAMSENCYVFAGGGTGGHLYPGLAVAEALRNVDPAARLIFLTTTRELDRQVLGPVGYDQVPQPVRPLTLHPLRVPGFLVAWRRSVALARDVLRRCRVRAVLGLGGYAAGPAVVAASRMKIRSAILNPDAIPGRANRYLARFASLVVLQWEVSGRYFSARTQCMALGCPIRASFEKASADEGRRRFGLDPSRPVLLVTGASQGARSVNETLAAVWPAFHRDHPDWQLLHLTGSTDEGVVRSSYASAAAPAQVLAFTHDMPLALAAADVVVARAGASTLAELGALGKPAILLPYPYHRDQHQRRNAQVLVDAGAAILVEDQRSGEANAPALRAALEQLLRPEVRARMSAAAARLGRPAAATAVARWLTAGSHLG